MIEIECLMEIVSISSIHYYNKTNIYHTIYCPARFFNNEYFQSVRQEYEFTFMDHIYTKDKKYYKYNNKTLTFDEIEGLICPNNEESVTNEQATPNEPTCDIGPNEKCKSCDLNQPEFCDECNDGYYLYQYDKTKCRKCSMEKCKVCPNDICLHCMDENSGINYPLLTEEEALEITLKNMNLHKHSSKNIYCEPNKNS